MNDSIANYSSTLWTKNNVDKIALSIDSADKIIEWANCHEVEPFNVKSHEELYECKKLVFFDVERFKNTHYDALRKLPLELSNLTNIVECEVKVGIFNACCLDPITNLLSLQKLTLNPSKTGNGNLIPTSISNLVNLTELDLNHNLGFHDAIGNLVNLKKLSFGVSYSCYSPVSVPTFISNLVNLEELSMKGNFDLNIFPQDISRLERLKKLKIDSPFTPKGLDCHLSKRIGELRDLTELELIDRKLMGLPETIGNLSNLTRLHLSGAVELRFLPDSIGKLINLATLTLSLVNRLECLPSSIGDLKNLKKLWIFGGYFLQTLPNTIGRLSNLESLLLDGKLLSIPETIGGLVNLKELILDENELTSIPEAIGSLTKLKVLNLQSNKLTSLPESIGNLVNLEELSVWGNTLSALPESIGNLNKLTKLNLEDHQLKSLPKTIGLMTGLTKLNLSQNDLQTLPVSIGNLTNLEELDLGFNNNLKMIPESIKNLLPTLKKLVIPEHFEELIDEMYKDLGLDSFNIVCLTCSN